jgi:hypothetical protein
VIGLHNRTSDMSVGRDRSLCDTRVIRSLTRSTDVESARGSPKPRCDPDWLYHLLVMPYISGNKA